MRLYLCVYPFNV